MKKRLMQDSQKTARSGPHPVQRTIATDQKKKGRTANAAAPLTVRLWLGKARLRAFP